MDGQTLFPYSMDLRGRVVAAVEIGGMSCHQAAAQFGVGVSTAIVWVRRLRETGSVAPGQMGGHKPKAISGEYRAWLLERTKARDFTLRGLVAELAERGLKVDYRAVWNFVHADRPDVASGLQDETWTRPNMTTLRGWPCGLRLQTKAPHGHWKTTTFLAALRHDRIDAPWLFDGPIDGESFRTYVEKVLVPTLRPGDIVIMDNLGSHKAKAVRQLIRAAGAKLILLPKTHRTGTRSSRSSPRSNTSCARPPPAPSKPSAPRSAKSSEHLHPTNAPTISKTQAMGIPDCIML